MAWTSYVGKERFPKTHERYWYWEVYQRRIDVTAPEQFREKIPPPIVELVWHWPKPDSCDDRVITFRLNHGAPKYINRRKKMNDRPTMFNNSRRVPSPWGLSSGIYIFFLQSLYGGEVS